MANVYENVIQEFNKRNCKLLVSKEEYNEIIANSKTNYMASCGHNHF